MTIFKKPFFFFLSFLLFTSSFFVTTVLPQPKAVIAFDKGVEAQANVKAAADYIRNMFRETLDFVEAKPRLKPDYLLYFGLQKEPDSFFSWWPKFSSKKKLKIRPKKYIAIVVTDDAGYTDFDLTEHENTGIEKDDGRVFRLLFKGAQYQNTDKNRNAIKALSDYVGAGAGEPSITKPKPRPKPSPIVVKPKPTPKPKPPVVVPVVPIKPIQPVRPIIPGKKKTALWAYDGKPSKPDKAAVAFMKENLGNVVEFKSVSEAGEQGHFNYFFYFTLQGTERVSFNSEKPVVFLQNNRKTAGKKIIIVVRNEKNLLTVKEDTKTTKKLGADLVLHFSFMDGEVVQKQIEKPYAALRQYMGLEKRAPVAEIKPVKTKIPKGLTYIMGQDLDKYSGEPELFALAAEKYLKDWLNARGFKPAKLGKKANFLFYFTLQGTDRIYFQTPDEKLPQDLKQKANNMVLVVVRNELNVSGEPKVPDNNLPGLGLREGKDLGVHFGFMDGKYQNIPFNDQAKKELEKYLAK